jgi:hypothetical protein
MRVREGGVAATTRELAFRLVWPDPVRVVVWVGGLTSNPRTGIGAERQTCAIRALGGAQLATSTDVRGTDAVGGY